ncbi:MAG: helix-turn-helix transcriptional regulator [Spirochaetales bacterium]|nr:helix-turn-helix transcriptional regulator [Spirochaetales bacterium]
MENSGYLTQFLYLLVYSSSLLSAASVVVFRKKLNTDRPALKLILLISACTSLLSIQVFFNAVGLLEVLNEAESSRIIFMLNMLIIAGIAGIVYFSVSVSFALRPAESSKIVQRITAVLAAAILMITIILQLLTLFAHSLPASELLGITMISGLAGFSGGIIFAAVRLFIPLTLRSDARGHSMTRLLLLLLFTFPALFFVSGSAVGTILAPSAFIILNVICLRIIYTRAAGSQTEAELRAIGSIPAPFATCRELGLSKRESEVALLLSQGRSYKEISAELYISMSTTQTHVGRIYSKLGINNKTELSNLLNYREN